MSIPRLAIGTIQADADETAMTWGLLSVLEQAGYQVQGFHYQANFVPRNGTRTITGQEQRHLDSWLMPRELCRELFQFGSRGSDIAVVEGRYDSAQEIQGGGSLDTLCEWLELPRVVVLDAGAWGLCQRMNPPAHATAILLDRVTDCQRATELATTLETLSGIPVVGWMPMLDGVRRTLAHLPRGSAPSADLCRTLGNELRPRLQLEKLLRIANRTARIDASGCPSMLKATGGRRMRIAVAFDDAFHCYFPDTLDMLEACGGEVRTFSPLSGADLPADTDLVYLGCGRIDRHADALASNHCLKQALHAFATAGGRIYAEGAGLAYLCRQLVLENGRRYPMVNILPAVASRNPSSEPMQPSVMRLKRATWLGDAFQELRGYLNQAWRISSWGTTTSLALEPENQGDLFGHRNVIGSRMHLNFAAQPHFLQSFFRPYPLPYAKV